LGFSRERLLRSVAVRFDDATLAGDRRLP
jgi:hypothetical protein